MFESKGIQMRPEIQFLKPLGFHDYNALQLNSFAVLSDSGTISEESSILNFPALNLREAHERPEAMEEAAVMMVGMNPERILQGLSQITTTNQSERVCRPVADYSMPNVSEKVVRIIISYVDYIKRVVWKEL
jgi:UDP-N-acetylglucosamine 2-epimerase (non-hydrolysing)